MDTATERQPLLQHHDTLSNSEDPARAGAAPDAEDDPVFSAISLREGLSNAVDFRSLEWPAASVMLVKIQIGLGVLSLPSAMKTLGLIPGTAVLVGCGAMVTLANWISGEFRHANPTVHSVADVAGILGGKVAREVTGVGYIVFSMMIAGSAMLAVSIGLNTILRHFDHFSNICTVQLVALTAFVTCALASYRELRHIAILGWLGTASIFISVAVLVAAVLFSPNPPLAPPDESWEKHIELFGSASFTESALSVLDIVVAFSGTPMYFSVISEMREPKDYHKALSASQTICITFYLVVSIIVYLCCGQYLTSPALGSAGPVIARVLYALALPGMTVGAVLFTHLSAKWALVKMLRGSEHLQKSTVIHWVTWLGAVGVSGLVSFTVAESIPFFSALLALIGSLGSSTFCFVIPSLCYFNMRPRKSYGITPLYIINVVILLTGVVLCIGGTWASISVIKQQLAREELSQPFSCADNSSI